MTQGTRFLRFVERCFWDTEPIRTKPWHAFNAVFATVLLLLAIAFAGRFVLSVSSALWGIVCFNSLGAWMVRREARRVGIDLDQRYDEA